MRSKSRLPGLAPSQLPDVLRKAAELGGAHILIFRGRDLKDEASVFDAVAPYFRVRWIEAKLLSLIPHSMDEFGKTLNGILGEELEWNSAVRPHDERCCLLLSEASFSAEPSVRHVWKIAGQAGTERIKGTVRAVERFGTFHWNWLPREHKHSDGERVWIDQDNRVFGHRGPRHGDAPFPRMWKFSHPLPPGFHFDVTSRSARAFRVASWDSRWHDVAASAHINIDAHGHVRRS
jgi:hypothetical protein